MPGGGTIRMYADKATLYKKYKQLIGTLKMVTLARYRQALSRTQTRDHALKFTRKAFEVDVEGDVDYLLSRDGENTLWVPIMTNRGSCGALNTNIVRYLQASAAERDNIVGVGKKAQDALSRVLPENVQRVIINDMKQAQSVAFGAYVTAHIQSQEWDKCNILFHRFKSAASQELSSFQIPKFEDWVENIKKASGGASKAAEGELDNFQYYNALMEKDTETLRDYYDFQMAIALGHANMENELSEYAARIVAVENQLTNISNLLIEANYMYNKLRKEAITAELLEIISTMSALDSGDGDKLDKPDFWNS